MEFKHFLTLLVFIFNVKIGFSQTIKADSIFIHSSRYVIKHKEDFASRDSYSVELVEKHKNGFFKKCAEVNKTDVDSIMYILNNSMKVCLICSSICVKPRIVVEVWSSGIPYYWYLGVAEGKYYSHNGILLRPNKKLFKILKKYIAKSFSFTFLTKKIRC